MDEKDFESTMTVVELNNMIVKWRKDAKKAKNQMINKITRKLKIIKNKRIDEEKKIRKQEKLKSEIDSIKSSHLDDLIKFSLEYQNDNNNNNNNNNNIIKDDDNNNNNKIKINFSNNKIIKNKIKIWRENHKDWQHLSSFVNSHVARRMKRKKKNKNKIEDKNGANEIEECNNNNNKNNKDNKKNDNENFVENNNNNNDDNSIIKNNNKSDEDFFVKEFNIDDFK